MRGQGGKQGLCMLGCSGMDAGAPRDLRLISPFMTDEREPLKSMNETHKPPAIMPNHNDELEWLELDSYRHLHNVPH